MTTVDVAVIILTMNQKAKTLRCLESFGDIVTPPSYRLLLWDNGSSDGTAEAVAARFPDVLVHFSPQNAGVASGRNRAVAVAQERWSPRFYFFMDNDMTVAPDFLVELIKPFGDDPRLAQTTSKIRDMDDPTRLYGAGGCRTRFWFGDTRHVGYGEVDRGQYDTPQRCIPSGGSLFVRADVFHELGGFTTVYDPYGPEDLDFGLRARRAGYYGWYVPTAVVYHETRPSRTFEGGQYSETYAKHRARHWFTFMGAHASPWQKAGFYLIGLPYRLGALAVREARRGNLAPALKGLWRGFIDTLQRA